MPRQEAVNEFATRPSPVQLTQAELGQLPVTEAKNPIEVQAWVRYPETAVRVQGRALAWTARAVWVEFQTREGATHRAWVWASAVARLRQQP
jgi:hypothetical protein